VRPETGPHAPPSRRTPPPTAPLPADGAQRTPDGWRGRVDGPPWNWSASQHGPAQPNLEQQPVTGVERACLRRGALDSGMDVDARSRTRVAGLEGRRLTLKSTSGLIHAEGVQGHTSARGAARVPRYEAPTVTTKMWYPFLIEERLCS
jgi:hypothetical protein